MKRSTQIGLSAAGLLLVASVGSLTSRDEEAVVFADRSACRAEGGLTESQCEQRFAEASAAHLRDARKFGNAADCEAQYGPARCETRTWNGAQVVVPALAGVVLARSLLQGGGVAQPLLPPTLQACPPGSPRQECRGREGAASGWGGGGGHGSSGSRAYTSISGNPVVATDGRTRVSVASRGGFGEIGRSFGSSSS